MILEAMWFWMGLEERNGVRIRRDRSSSMKQDRAQKPLIG